MDKDEVDKRSSKGTVEMNVNLQDKEDETIFDDEDSYNLGSGSFNYDSSKEVNELSAIDWIPIVVCAIDFGTTYSGYSFAFTRSPENIMFMKSVGEQSSMILNQKIPTALLLQPDGKFHSFGYEAITKFSSLTKEEAKKWLFFEKFKMKLHQMKPLNEKSLIEANNGHYHNAMDVFSKSLQYLKDVFLKEMDNETVVKIDMENVKWVITVPAIWSYEARQFMRNAAYRGGLTSCFTPEKLVIALEPEAASIYCRRLRLRDCILAENFKEQMKDRKSIDETMDSIDQYIIVDCGGGTVDIAVHELDKNMKFLKEICPGKGGPHGALEVNMNFENYLRESMGNLFIDSFKKSFPSNWLELMNSFEVKKRFALPSNDRHINIMLPYNFIKHYKKKGKSSQNIKVRKNLAAKWCNEGLIRMDSQIVEEFFENVIRNIKSLINSILENKNMENVRYLFMVGGFANSPILQHEIRSAFNQRLEVIIPNEVSLSVLKGAVLFGLDPSIVKIRRSPFTYGFLTIKPFNKLFHDLSKKIIIENKEYCKDIFQEIIRAGDSVQYGSLICRKYEAASSKQNVAIINILKSESVDVKYSTEPGVQKCGKLVVSNPSFDANSNQKIKILVSLSFGDTEIKVSAKNIKTNQIIDANIDFSCH